MKTEHVEGDYERERMKRKKIKSELLGKSRKRVRQAERGATVLPSKNEVIFQNAAIFFHVAIHHFALTNQFGGSELDRLA
jgi:hypothetical protein